MERTARTIITTRKRGDFIGSLILVCLLCLLTAAVQMDIQTSRISNRLILAGLMIGYIRNLSGYGWEGSIYFLIQISLPVLIFYLLFLMRALGAGDIKLFSVISSCMGLEAFGKIAWYAFAAGAVCSVAVLFRNRNLAARIRYFCQYARTAVLEKSVPTYDACSDGKHNLIHFSVPIYIGFFCYLGGM